MKNMKQMVKLTNRLVQNELYKILNNENVFVEINTDKPKLVIVEDETTTTTYPYVDKDCLVADFKQIMEIKKLLNNN